MLGHVNIGREQRAVYGGRVVVGVKAASVGWKSGFESPVALKNQMSREIAR